MAEQAHAVERARASLRGPRHGRAAGAHRPRRRGDRQEARGVDEQRRLGVPNAARPAASSGPAAKPAERAASTIPVASVTRRAAATAGIRVNSAGWANALPAASSEESARITARSPLKAERGGDRRLGQRGGDEHADALEAVGDEPGQRRERHHRHQRRRDQRRHGQAAAGQLVDPQAQHDERQQVAGRREEDGAGQQAQVARGGG